MSDKNKKEIIADMNKKISQFQQWHIDYGSTGIKILDMRATIVNTLIESCESMMSEKNVDLDELDLEYQQLYSAISQLAKACKLKNLPSPTPRGGGSSLPSQITDARKSAKQYLIGILLPAFEEAMPVLGHYARVSAGDSGSSYNDADKTARDLLSRILDNWIDPQTTGAFRIHAKGLSNEELSDVEFLKENGLFNKAYVTEVSDGVFDTQEINGVTVLNYSRTMTNPKKKGGNS